MLNDGCLQMYYMATNNCLLLLHKMGTAIFNQVKQIR